MTSHELNEEIAKHFGWRPESDFHDFREEWEGWRDPDGQQGFGSVPDFLCILKHFIPAVQGVLKEAMEE